MSRELFASTTGDTRYNLFFGPEEMDLFDNYSTELFEIVTQTSVKYWRIEKDFSNPNNIYGESDSKVARQPVTVYCFIQQEEPVTESGRYGTDIKRRLELYMHKDRLTEVGVVPRIGDFIEYSNQFYEIYEANSSNLYTYSETKMGVLVRCLSAREGVFDGMRDNANNEYNANSDNPY